MRLSEVLRLGYANGTPTVCGKRGRHSLEDLLEVDALRARLPSFRAGPDPTSPQLELLAAARYLVYGSNRTPTICHGTATTPSPPSSSAAAAAEAEGAASSIPSTTPTPAAAAATDGDAGRFAAAADTASQLIGSVPYSSHPLHEHPQYAPSFPGVQPTHVPYTAEGASQLEHQYMPLYTAQQLQYVQPPLIPSDHHHSYHNHHQQQQQGAYYYQQQSEYCYCYQQQQQLGYCFSEQQHHEQQQQYDGYFYHHHQPEFSCYQQQLAPQNLFFAASQPHPDAQASNLMLLQQQQAQQQQQQQQQSHQLGSQFYPQLQQQQDMCAVYDPSSFAHPSQAPSSDMQLTVAFEEPSMHLPAPVQRPRMYYPARTFQLPSRDLPPGPQPTSGPAELDSDDLPAGLSEYHSGDQDDIIDEDDDIIDDDISDNGTELGSEFDSDPENLVDRSAEGADADDEQQSEGPGFDSEGTSDFEDAVDDYGTTEEEEENNSIPPAELEAILAENARLWGHLAAQGGPQGMP